MEQYIVGYEYTCLPNGLSTAPRILINTMKPVFAKLRLEGHVSVYYLDDSWLVAETQEDCEHNVTVMRQLLRHVGFVIHQDESSFTPSQHIQFIGFSLNSVDMTVELPTHKKARITHMCNTLLQVVRLQFVIWRNLLGSLFLVSLLHNNVLYFADTLKWIKFWLSKQTWVISTLSCVSHLPAFLKLFDGRIMFSRAFGTLTYYNFDM